MPQGVRGNRLVFPPSGAASQTQFVTVPIIGDKVREDPEQFLLTLERPEDAVLAEAFGVATIRDND